jgi:hypothetical protein
MAYSQSKPIANSYNGKNINYSESITKTNFAFSAIFNANLKADIIGLIKMHYPDFDSIIELANSDFEYKIECKSKNELKLEYKIKTKNYFNDNITKIRFITDKIKALEKK